MEDFLSKLRDKAFDRLLEEKKAEYNGTLEPYEVYAARLKSQLHASFDQYLDHLEHGYELIINKIGSKQK